VSAPSARPPSTRAPSARPSSIVVRDARREDLRSLLGLLEQLQEEATPFVPWPDVGEDDVAAFLDEILAQPGRAVLIADDDGEPCGALDLIVLPNLTHGAAPIAWIENVVVDESHRRRGVGRTLIEEATRRAADAGCYKVQLLSNRRRASAHAFYESLGFEPSAHGFRRYLP
jgi:GNAT superfamily N-acetyltransferase